MTQADTEKLRELLAKATPGPWTGGIEEWRYPECDDADLPGAVRCPSGQMIAHIEERYDNGDDNLAEPNTALIVAAVNALPALLARQAALEDALRKLTERFDGFMTCNDGHMGNQEQAYQRLVKNAFADWEAARTLSNKEADT